MAIGSSAGFPTLESMTQLFRAQINDSFSGATNTPGEGLIMTDLNPDLLTFLDSSLRELYSDLRNVGDPELILDNYILTGLPPVNSALTPPNPAAQVSLGFTGFFDGVQVYSQWTLPSGMTTALRLWERWSGTTNIFAPMGQARFGLPPVGQTNCMGQWESRQNAIWMPGALVPIDIRMRCRITFPDFLNPATLDFATTTVPIQGCQNAVVAKMVILYAKRFAPESYAMAVQDETRLMAKLRLEVVRAMQGQENERAAFGEEAIQSMATPWNWL
jgi:hypothetical protein